MSSTHSGPGGFGGDVKINNLKKERINRSDSSFHANELKRYRAKEKELTKELAALHKQLESDSLMRKRCRLLEEESRILKN